MALNNTTPARDAFTNAIHYISAAIGFADNGKAVTVGAIPAGATIVKPISGLQVNTAFNGTSVLDIGTTATADLYATDLATGTVTFVPIDEAVGLTVSADTTITATLAGTNPSAGAGVVVIAFIPRTM